MYRESAGYFTDYGQKANKKCQGKWIGIKITGLGT